MPTVDDFEASLRKQLAQAKEKGLAWIEINAGELHRAVGGYPNNGRHSMPTCCEVMYKLQSSSDRIVSKPPKGKGASLTIRYNLPR